MVTTRSQTNEHPILDHLHATRVEPGYELNNNRPGRFIVTRSLGAKNPTVWDGPISPTNELKYKSEYPDTIIVPDPPGWEAWVAASQQVVDGLKFDLVNLRLRRFGFCVAWSRLWTRWGKSGNIWVLLPRIVLASSPHLKPNEVKEIKRKYQHKYV